MKHKFLVLGLLVAVLVFTSACGMVNSLLGSGSAGTVSELWDDVPRMDGMTKADMDMPLAARLTLQAIMQGRVNFIAYTTDATSQAVFDYYTADRMSGEGWKTQEGMGCFSASESAEEGTICVFTKDDSSKNEVLAIVSSLDTNTNKTAIFFARIDATEQTPEASN